MNDNILLDLNVKEESQESNKPKKKRKLSQFEKNIIAQKKHMKNL